MTDASHNLQSYEVRCPRCNVSFPPETRTCVHCGGPVGGGRIARVMRVEDPGHRAGLDPTARPYDAAPEEEEGESSSPLRYLGNIVWVIMVAYFIYARACGSE